MKGSPSDTANRIGKKVAGQSYAHVSLIPSLGGAAQRSVEEACTIADINWGEEFNVVKLSEIGGTVSLLSYPAFMEEPFPALAAVWTIDLTSRSVRFRTYEDSLNPPILHRKELLLPENHPRRPEFEGLTQSAESIGLFDDPLRIGFQRPWESMLAQKGYRIVGHNLVPIGNEEAGAAIDVEETAWVGIARHRTALSRYGLSAPVQTLARFGFLEGTKSLFDYGCGRGDDVRGLRENGIEAAGWDPYFAPDEEIRSAPLVNLGFVINVIEDRAERLEALQGAYALADELLVVSAMIAHPDAVQGVPYGDGILTRRNTFQKYYSQEELRDWLAESLGAEPLPVGPGIFYLFKDKDAEQRFLLGRQENRRTVLRLARLSRPEKQPRLRKAEAKYLEHRQVLENLWESCLALGRYPDRSEVPDLATITEHFGTLSAALRFIRSHKEEAETIMNQARRARMDDLRVYFAECQFQRRPSYRHLETGLQRDVKAFFGDYRAAQEAGRELLFAAGNVETLESACREAAERGLGWLEERKSLQLPTRQISELPPVLRTYVTCGLRLYGDPESADLIKIHIGSGKLTLMTFDDFDGRPLPKMLRRVKLRLRTQDMDLFEYGDAYPPPYLFRKSRFINEEFPHYAEQRAFDELLEALGFLDFEGYGPIAADFDARLEAARYALEGFSLVRSRRIPDLDASCGRYFTYRDLIHCGETQSRTRVPNIPQQPDTYTALRDLAVHILDPVIEYFGMIRLTYGFSSQQLANQIKQRIAPELDQHAGHELTRSGKAICSRLGAAVDFLVEDEDMAEVAAWVIENLPFDRLYFYGNSQPIHVSWSKDPAGEPWQIYERNGRRIPKRFNIRPD